jgi:hypothetical protein
MLMSEKQNYIKNEYGHLTGRTIKGIRPLTDEENEDFGWDGRWDVPFVIILDDGTALIPSQDPEGNGPGHIFVEKVEQA